MKPTAKRIFSLVFSVVACCALAMPVLAANPINVQDSFKDTLKSSGLIDQRSTGLPQVETTLGLFINSILGLIGVATFVLVVYAGGLWLTAAGNEDKITKAKDILKGAVLGLVIIFTASILVNAALVALQSAVSGSVPG